ncbi:hypothetical protein CE91St46_01840 [Eubacteriales bacterium]|nr:helix-turn-helix domain-containing protein [Oscillospiraceae bacterium]MBS1380685.1 helix-turn-helix domain-containing protein [Oscillospiraceae bacterium]GKH49073.1 hypothetical protein CE91St46_01840 [Eubacteriales bacterium]GKH61714.1 hypothetical protein CE91St47_01830 [Eubacteriales bacterium]
MPIRYKLDVLAALREAGYSQNKIRDEKLIGQATLTQLRHGELVSWKTINTICRLLCCQPGDILEYAPNVEDFPHE